MWSLYVGRPVGLDDKNITVPFSEIDTNSPHAQKFWFPYMEESEEPDTPSMIDPIEELTIWNVKLCANMTIIRETLSVLAQNLENGLLTSPRYPDGLADPKSPRQLYDFASAMRLTLQQWQADLPLNLRFDDSDSSTVYLPHVLQLQ